MTDAAAAYQEMATWAAQLDVQERYLTSALDCCTVPTMHAHLTAVLAEVRDLAAVALVAVTQKEAELRAVMR